MLIWERPWALWLALALPAIVVLYFLRTRWKTFPVGSTFIWRRLADQNDAGRKLRRRGAALLALQLGAAAAAVLTAAGPILRTDSLAEPGLAFIIDASVSMATPDGPGGADRMKAAADALGASLADLHNDQTVALFAASSVLRPLVEPTADHGALLRAAGRLKADGCSLDEAAVAGALSAWLKARDEAWSVVFLSDGVLEGGGRTLAEAAEPYWSTVNVGSRAAPPSVTGLWLRQDGDKVLGDFLCHSGQEDGPRVLASLSYNGIQVAERELNLPAGWSRASLAWDGSIEPGAYELTVSERGADSSPWPGSTCRLAVNRVDPPRVLVLGRPDSYLRTLLLSSGVSAFTASGLPDADSADWDLVISLGPEVPPDYPANVFLIGPEATGAMMPDDDGTDTAPASPSGSLPGHPLNRYVRWEDFGPIRAGGLPASSTASVLAELGRRPLASARTLPSGWRAVRLAPNLTEGRFALTPSWPAFLRNVLDWCVPRADAQSVWTLAAGSAVERLVSPGFRADGLAIARHGPRATVTAAQTGLLRWEDGLGGSGSIAVNPPASELDAAPRALPFSGQHAAPGARVTTRDRKLSGAAALALLALLAAEWLAFRGRAPGRKGHA
ncbi:MAG TPA: VWA domain-containing protein [Spirochaetales bacterium]|nr:VWA domain-containing protein [Spirochaetales bacterium]